MPTQDQINQAWMDYWNTPIAKRGARPTGVFTGYPASGKVGKGGVTAKQTWANPFIPPPPQQQQLPPTKKWARVPTQGDQSRGQSASEVATQTLQYSPEGWNETFSPNTDKKNYPIPLPGDPSRTQSILEILQQGFQWAQGPAGPRFIPEWERQDKQLTASFNAWNPFYNAYMRQPNLQKPFGNNPYTPYPNGYNNQQFRPPSGYPGDNQQEFLPVAPGELTPPPTSTGGGSGYGDYSYPVYDYGGYGGGYGGGGGYAYNPAAWMSRLLNWNVNR
jgi:hypothetical protein